MFQYYEKPLRLWLAAEAEMIAASMALSSTYPALRQALGAARLYAREELSEESLNEEIREMQRLMQSDDLMTRQTARAVWAALRGDHQVLIEAAVELDALAAWGRLCRDPHCGPWARLREEAERKTRAEFAKRLEYALAEA
jgi:hypothetical protein